MISKVFSIFDSKIGVYNQPFLQMNKGHALRTFQDLIQKDKNLSNHPADFTLFELGTYDDATGFYTSLKTPLSCGVAIEYVKEDPQLDLLSRNRNGVITDPTYIGA